MPVIFYLFLLATLIFHFTESLPGGAPTSACDSFMPRHVDRTNGGFLSSQNTNSSPFSIQTSRTNFSRNTMIKVWITEDRSSDPTGYRGILLQARLNNSFSSGPQGTWRNPPMFTKLITCSNRSDAVTHSEVRNVKDRRTEYTWRSPCDQDIDDIVFIATVAESREIFWPEITSDVVMSVTEDGSGEAMPEVCEEDGASTVYVSMVGTMITLMAALAMS